MSGRGAVLGAAGLTGVAAAGWGVHRAWRALLAGAQAPGRRVGVDEDLTLMFQTLQALRDLGAQEDGAPSSEEVYGFSIRWGTMLAGRLARLAHYRDDGRLAAEQRDRFDRLRDELRDALPLIDRLGLVRPAVVLGETGSAQTRHRRHDEK